MATVEIKFEFTNGLEVREDCEEFDAERGVLARIDEYADEFVSDLNAEQEENDDCLDEWECTGWEVESFETEYEDQEGPDDFANLDEWGEYCEEADSADSMAYRYGGDAFVARHADVGSCDIDDFVGSYGSFEEYAETYVDDCLDIPDSMRCYFDIEKFASDLEMDHSVYDGGEGVLIFRDC